MGWITINGTHVLIGEDGKAVSNNGRKMEFIKPRARLNIDKAQELASYRGMKIDFSSDIRYQNWRNVVSRQHQEHWQQGRANEWFQWLEQEWKCKLEITLIDNQKMIEAMYFTEENYLMAVLRYGPPEVK